MKDKAKEYFEAFNNQDISKLEELYSDDIRLRDWLTEARGRDDVIISNRKLFKSNQKIKININDMHHDDNVVACEIEILLNNDDSQKRLMVVDVIEFDDDGRINEIRAYLGNI
tara:strand:+ start:11388 stop:11726 length:339 start_codon:yes stop_codon:yes gene_type:complete